MIFRRKADRFADDELDAAHRTLRMGGPPTGEPWDVVERLIVDWPSVRAAWETVQRITGAFPNVEHCHPYVIRRFQYATFDPNRPPQFEDAMWGDGIDDSRCLCDMTAGWKGLERSQLKDVRIVNRARVRVGFLEKFAVDEVFPTRAAAEAEADARTAQTRVKFVLLRDDLLREDGGWRIAPRPYADVYARRIKRDKYMTNPR